MTELLLRYASLVFLGANPRQRFSTAKMTIQAIAGVSPAESRETTVMTVWPSVAKYSLGRTLGGLYSIRFPDVYFLRLGNLFALMFIPVSLVIYFLRVLPYVGLRYTLTNRRVVIQKGLMPVDDQSVDLDRFDSIEVQVQPGQAWYDAGDLVFKLGNLQTFRLEAVSRPESFRQTILKTRMGHVGVKKTKRPVAAMA